MADINEVHPKTKLKIITAHPDFDSYDEGRKASIIKNQVAKDKKVAARTAKRQADSSAAAASSEQEAAKSVPTTPVEPRLAYQIGRKLNTDNWVAPHTTHHDDMYTAMDALDNHIDANYGKKDYSSVQRHLSKADAHLSSHLQAHMTGQAPLAAAHLEEAGKHITNAYRAMDVLHSGTSKPKGDGVELYTKGKAADYKINYAPGSKMSAPEPIKDQYNVSAPKDTRTRADKAATKEANEQKRATQAEAEATKQPSIAELKERKAKGDALVKQIVESTPKRNAKWQATPVAERRKNIQKIWNDKQAAKKAATAEAAPKNIKYVDRDGFSEEDHDKAFEPAYAHYWAGKKQTAATHAVYMRHDAFNKPARYMASVARKSEKKAASTSAPAGTPKAGPVTVTQGKPRGGRSGSQSAFAEGSGK